MMKSDYLIVMIAKTTISVKITASNTADPLKILDVNAPRAQIRTNEAIFTSLAMLFKYFIILLIFALLCQLTKQILLTLLKFGKYI